MTNAEKNQMALIAAAAVALTLFMIFPVSRGWIVGHSVTVTTYTYDAFVAPVWDSVTVAVVTAWGWLGGLLPW